MTANILKFESKMKRIKRTKTHIGLEDFIKASKRGNREAEQEMLGPGFHSLHRVHRSKKTYTRKEKHKGGEY